MENSTPRPDTINNLRFAANGAFAMLAGMQLDVFTPMKDGPLTAEQIAAAIGVGPSRLRLLLYVLVTAGLLTEQDGHFSNTAEANHFLVKGGPAYLGNRHAAIAMWWTAYLKTAESIRSGVPQAKMDFSDSPQEEVEAFLRSINANTVPAACTLVDKYDFSSARTELTMPCEYSSFNELWRRFLTGEGPGGAYVLGLKDDHREALRQRLRHDVLHGDADGPFSLQAKAWAVKGRVP